MRINEVVKKALANAANSRGRGVIIMTPVADAKPDVCYVQGVIMTLMHQKADAHQFIWGDSNIPHVRNAILNRFMQTSFDQVVLIDADIGWSLQDWDYLMEGPEEVVCAEYARKTTHPDIQALPVRGGMGFTRIARSALEKLIELRTDEGADRIPRYYEDGRMMVDFHYTGATSDGHWMSEDRGFFRYCQLAGVAFRNETRTRLDHVGRAVYRYKPNVLDTCPHKNQRSAEGLSWCADCGKPLED